MEPMQMIEREVASTLADVAAVTYADKDMVERLIRTARAAATEVPPAAPAGTRRHRVVWVKPLLAAAAVAAVAVCAALLLIPPAHLTPPSTVTTSAAPTATSPTPPPSSSSVAPVARGPFTPWTCQISPPYHWDAAWSPIIPAPGAPSVLSAAGLSIMAMSSTGAVLASSTFSSQADVVLVSADRSTRVLYQLPSSLAGQTTLRIGAGQVDTQWAVFAVIVGGGQGAVGAIDAVELSTGALHVVRDAGQGTRLIVSAPQLLNGHVYWSEVDTSGRGHIYDYDLATGTRSTLDSGTVSDPQVVGGAVEWGRNGAVIWHGTPTLPPGLQSTAGKIVTLLRDGTTFAWTAWTGTGAEQKEAVYMAKVGSARPEVVYTPPSPDIIPRLLALSGPYVIFDNTSIVALDTRSGAAATIADSQPPFTTAAAGGGVIALNVIGAKGGAQLVLVRTTNLSELHC